MYTCLRHININGMFWNDNYDLVCKDQQHFGFEKEGYKEIKNVHHDIIAAENKKLLANVKAKYLERLIHKNCILTVYQVFCCRGWIGTMSLQLRSHTDAYRNDDTTCSFHQWRIIWPSINGTEHIFFYIRNSKYDDCTHDHRNVSEGKQILFMGTVNTIFDLFIFRRFFFYSTVSI